METWKAFEVTSRVCKINGTNYIHLDKHFCGLHDIQKGDLLNLIAHSKQRGGNICDLVFIPKVIKPSI